MKKAQKDLKKQAWKGSKKPDEDAHEEDAAPSWEEDTNTSQHDCWAEGHSKQSSKI